MNKSFRFLQLNKGDADISSRVDQINDILAKYKPHLLVVNELNMKSTDKVTRQLFENYSMETDNLDVVDKMARTGILIHRDMHYKRRRDLESTGTSTVWLQLSYPGKRPILFQAIYRQFQRLGRKGSINPSQQHSRWDTILSKWEKAMEEDRELITMGDFNLNLLRWDIPAHQKNSYDALKKPMIEGLQKRILDKGFQIISNKPTRVKENPDAEPSCLDLMITNQIDKISSHQAGVQIFSDHTLQIIHRTTKKIHTTQKYLRIRSFQNFSIQEYRQNVLDHQKYIEMLYEQDPENLTKGIQTIIQESLNELAPMKLIQISKKNKTPLSNEIKERMIDRELAHLKYKETNKMEDLRNFRNIKN